VISYSVKVILMGSASLMIEFRLNGAEIALDVPAEMPLLWVLRDRIGLTGTKYACGIALGGACTVHLDGRATRSCVLPVSTVAGRDVTTIEGLASDSRLHPVQQAWIDEQVPQCGYCQPGMIMAVAAFLAEHPSPDDAAIDRTITNICRCGTYPRIRKAIHRAAGQNRS
jgi:isoquinoline 1-oxidoreductase alpha subunit